MIVSNKTNRPLSLALGGGKILHLGPRKTGQISAKAAEDPRLKNLVGSGEIEIQAEDARSNAGPVSGRRYGSAGHRQTSGNRRSGDR